MELLTYPKTDHLLNAGLETLHMESVEWIRELDFWSDEIVFFYKLLRRKEINDPVPSERLAALEKELVWLHSDRIDQLKNELHNHEKLLAGLLRSQTKLEDKSYRDVHRKIYESLSDLHRLIRAFKKEVFDFVHKH